MLVTKESTFMNKLQYTFIYLQSTCLSCATSRSCSLIISLLLEQIKH